MKKIDITGNRYGMLVVLSSVESKQCGKQKKTMWLCRCDCGNTKTLLKSSLTSGKTISCGCLLKKGQLKHGYANREKLYAVWRAIKKRCRLKNDPAYCNYGGRGVGVCDEWKGSNPKGFSNFYDWAMKSGYEEHFMSNGRNFLTLDRIDTDKGYSPDNCRWITNEEQQNNKRADKLFEYNGECKTIKLWLKQYFVKCNDYYRLARLGLTNKNILDFVSSKHQIDINSKIGKGDRYKYTDNQSSVYDRITNKIWDKCDFLCSCTDPTHPHFSTED